MAQATAVMTFTAAGPDSQTFTWSPALTSNPPKVVGHSVEVTSISEGPVAPDIDGTTLTNTGGTCRISAPTDCVVTLIAID